MKKLRVNQMSSKNLLFCCLLLLMQSEVVYGSITPVTNTYSQEMLAKGTYNKSCPLPPTRLSIVTFKYIDFAGKVHNDGKIMVMDAVAENVENIFNELFAIKFPIAKSKLIEAYNGKDGLSLADNNTGSFNCRAQTFGSSLSSMHSFGLAIDINPVQNPYVKYDKTKKHYAIVLPLSGSGYLNRSNIRAGMAETVVNIFRKHGFTIWGGNWNDPIDWQHFQVPGAVAKLLAAMNQEDGKDFFNLYAQNPKLFNEMHYNDDRFIKLYKENPELFMKSIHD